MNYIFYDTETTGLDHTFDQILQFAAILTDSDFNELDRFEMRCQIQPHVIPAPEALLATRVSPAMLTDLQLPSHYQLMQSIVETLNKWSPSIFLGYNTISFDEPMLRQAFYQTLHPTFLTNTNGNQRGDIFRLVQATSVLRPDVINVPKNKVGKPILKLDRLAPENGFAHDNAHDALADVEATIYIANLVRKRAPNIWSSLIPLVDKSQVIQRISGESINCLVDYFGGELAVCAITGCSDQNAGSSLMAVFDVSYNPENYINLSVDEIAQVTSQPKGAIKIIRTNKMPAVMSFDHIRNPEQKLQLTLSELHKRVDYVNNAKEFHRKVTSALMLHLPNEEPNKIIEKRIYERFPSNHDQKLMKEFHSGSAARQLEIISLFEDERLQEIGRRIIFLENPNILDNDIKHKLEKWVNNRRNGRDGIVSGRTIKEVNADIEKLLEKIPEHRNDIVAIQKWLNPQENHY